MINDSPSVIYSYPLLFSPPSSWLHQYYHSERSHEIGVVKGLSGWGNCFRLVNSLQSRAVGYYKNVVVVSRNNTVAISKGYGNIAIFDTITSIRIASYPVSNDLRSVLTFSIDGLLLVSGNNCGVISLWDIQTGGQI